MWQSHGASKKTKNESLWSSVNKQRVHPKFFFFFLGPFLWWWDIRLSCFRINNGENSSGIALRGERGIFHILSAPQSDRAPFTEKTEAFIKEQGRK